MIGQDGEEVGRRGLEHGRVAGEFLTEPVGRQWKDVVESDPVSQRLGLLEESSRRGHAVKDWRQAASVRSFDEEEEHALGGRPARWDAGQDEDPLGCLHWTRIAATIDE